LNHPNICTIYEVDEADRRTFIAMELLEGQTLRYMIAGRGMEIETVLDLGVQIADGLEAEGPRNAERCSLRCCACKRKIPSSLAPWLRLCGSNPRPSSCSSRCGCP